MYLGGLSRHAYTMSAANKLKQRGIHPWLRLALQSYTPTIFEAAPLDQLTVPSDVGFGSPPPDSTSCVRVPSPDVRGVSTLIAEKQGQASVSRVDSA